MEDPRLKARNAIGSLIATAQIDPRRSTWRDQIAMATESAHHGLQAELETPCQNRQPAEVDNWRERERERGGLDASSLDKEDGWEFAYLPHMTCAH